MKTVKVNWRDPETGQWDGKDVDLPLPADTPLRPHVARMAAISVLGYDVGAWVITDDGYGYALYPKWQRKLVRGIDYDRE